MNGKKWSGATLLLLVLSIPGPWPALARDAVIADHRAAAAFGFIPEQFIKQAKSQFRLYYGHTSHGSQIMTGLEMLRDALHSFNSGPGSLYIEETYGDLGHNGDLAWCDTTRARLNEPGNNINMVMWSWCGGVSNNTPQGINAYLNAMSKLEQDYPHVTFVYMTGHTDGSGVSGNLNVRNNQIRNFCRKKGKVLFDFADIESWDPAGQYYPDTSDDCGWCSAWCSTHTCPGCSDCAHSHCFNCYLKGEAFWWMMARVAGWAPGAGVPTSSILLLD
ncbi:MAG: hypothetical protein FJ126_00215 [Deltaproteobacteria bacterium]|nr:hypothetical protein [Deltaproteobacteria bacterium]